MRFNKIANLVGIKSKCFLTDGNYPQQPYIGRGEAILALQKIFTCKEDIYLKKHLNYCFAMASSISINKNENTYLVNSLYDAFLENVTNQGGEISSLARIAYEVSEKHDYRICANKNGILSIDLGKMRSAILNIQSKSKEIFPDNCGIILKNMPNTYVRKGDIICTFRCDTQYKEEFENSINNSIGTSLRKTKINTFKEIP